MTVLPATETVLAWTAPARAVLARAVLAQTPSPAPVPAPDDRFTIYNVTPGIEGFAAFFVLAVAAFLIGRAVIRRQRRVDAAAAARGLPRSGPGHRAWIRREAEAPGDAAEPDPRDDTRFRPDGEPGSRVPEE